MINAMLIPSLINSIGINTIMTNIIIIITIITIIIITTTRTLDHPKDKYVVFVYHEHGLKNGGFGDRIAGNYHHHHHY